VRVSVYLVEVLEDHHQRLAHRLAAAIWKAGHLREAWLDLRTAPDWLRRPTCQTRPKAQDIFCDLTGPRRVSIRGKGMDRKLRPKRPAYQPPSDDEDQLHFSFP
jgi:hypothetical protein